MVTTYTCGTCDDKIKELEKENERLVGWCAFYEHQGGTKIGELVTKVEELRTAQRAYMKVRNDLTKQATRQDLGKAVAEAAERVDKVLEELK